MENKKIMIVEDERIVARDIQHGLENQGFSVSTIVSSGEEAVNRAEEYNPDIILMDIRLKGPMDGIEAANQIRQRADIPVIYLTAFANNETLARAKITEPFGYIIKPFSEKELFTTVAMALYKHKMEKKLKEREKWFRTTLRSIGDAVISTDKDGRVTFMNHVAESLTGWRMQEAVGKDIREVVKIISQDMGSPLENLLKEVVEKGAKLNIKDHCIVTKHGKEVPIDDSVAPIRDERLIASEDSSEIPVSENTVPIVDEKGEITGCVLVLQDITERKEAEEKLEQYRDHLEEMVRERTAELEVAKNRAEVANRAKSEFLANMSHELKTPLNAIIGFSEMMIDGATGELTEKQKEYLEDINESGHNLNSLIRNILFVSEMDAGEINYQKTNVESLIKQSLAILRKKIKPGLNLIVDTENDMPLFDVDEGKIIRVLGSILDNAFRFTDSGGTVSIKARLIREPQPEPESEKTDSKTEKEFIQVSVEDTGQGIKAEDIQHLFQPFKQLEKLYTKKHAGIGLRLFICKKIIEVHGGRIWAESEYGKGSRFAFILPVKQPA